MPDEHRALTVQFLDRVAERPRTRADVIETWQSTCPRLSVWEDALAEGLVRVEPGGSARVALSERGRSLLRCSQPRPGGQRPRAER